MIFCLYALLIDDLPVFNKFILDSFHRQVQRFYDQLESLRQLDPFLIALSILQQVIHDVFVLMVAESWFLLRSVRVFGNVVIVLLFLVELVFGHFGIIGSLLVDWVFVVVMGVNWVIFWCAVGCFELLAYDWAVFLVWVCLRWFFLKHYLIDLSLTYFFEFNF